MKPFTKENIENLKSTCEKIIALTNEHVDGELMMSQKLALYDNLVEFVANPIVLNSGLFTTEMVNNLS